MPQRGGTLPPPVVPVPSPSAPAHHAGAARAQRGRRLALVLAVLALVPLALLAARSPRPAMRPLPDGTATTDRGRPVHLLVFEGDTAPPAPRPGPEAAVVREPGLAGRVIATGPPDPAYNCHGWVFAAGRCVVDSDVDAILEDNGYVPVAEPRAGDVIVYRDGGGSVCHTGLVRQAGTSGAVLVESKWSGNGRYLHPAEVQPFGGEWAYYRSARPGHLLRGLDRPADPG